LLAGTDNIDTYVFSGSSLHDELEMMVDAGLSPLEALQTATINPAIYAGREQEFGSLEKGKRADIVLLNSNPLTDINNVRGIDGLLYNGFYYDRNALEKLDDFALGMAQSIRLNLRFLWDVLSSPLMRVQLAD
jgi:adenine deaminase